MRIPPKRMKTLYNIDRVMIVSSKTRIAKQGAIFRVTTDKVQLANEVWMYVESDNKFYELKNRGFTNAIVERMSDRGINIVPCATLHSGDVIEYRFDTDKDKFHFNLKFL